MYLICRTKSPLGKFLFLQAMIPLLVHDYYPGSFKWLLQGDDTTVFFKATVKKLLQQHDHTTPYLITSDCKWNKTRPPSEIPSCSRPCHHPSSFGCPCTPPRACCGFVPEKNCNTLCMSEMQRSQNDYSGCAWYWSAGLVQQLAKKRAAYESCAWSLRGYRGDFGQIRCLWELGYAPTTLWHSAAAGIQRERISEALPASYHMGSDVLLQLVKQADKNVEAAKQIASMASLHLQGLQCPLEASTAPCPSVSQAVQAIHAVHRLQTAEHKKMYLPFTVAGTDEVYPCYYGILRAAHYIPWLLVFGSTTAALAYVKYVR